MISMQGSQGSAYVTFEANLRAQKKMFERLSSLLQTPLTLDRVDAVLRTTVEALVLVFSLQTTAPRPVGVQGELVAKTAGLAAGKKALRLSVVDPSPSRRSGSIDSQASSKDQHRDERTRSASQSLPATLPKVDTADGAREKDVSCPAVEEPQREVDEGEGPSSAKGRADEGGLVLTEEDLVKLRTGYVNPEFECRLDRATAQVTAMGAQLADTLEQMEMIHTQLDKIPRLEAAIRQSKRAITEAAREQSKRLLSPLGATSFRRDSGSGVSTPQAGSPMAGLQVEVPDGSLTPLRMSDEVKVELEVLNEKVTALELAHEETRNMAKEKMRRFGKGLQDMEAKLVEHGDWLSKLESGSAESAQHIIRMQESQARHQRDMAKEAEVMKRVRAEMLAAVKDISGLKMDEEEKKMVLELHGKMDGMLLARDVMEEQTESLKQRCKSAEDWIRSLNSTMEAQKEEAKDSLVALDERINARISDVDERHGLAEEALEGALKTQIVEAISLADASSRAVRNQGVELHEALDRVDERSIRGLRRLEQQQATHEREDMQQHSVLSDHIKVLLPAVSDLQDELRTLYSLKADLRQLTEELLQTQQTVTLVDKRREEQGQQWDDHWKKNTDLPNGWFRPITPLPEQPPRPPTRGAASRPRSPLADENSLPLLGTMPLVSVKCLSCDSVRMVPHRDASELCSCGGALEAPSPGPGNMLERFPPSASNSAQHLFKHEIERRNISARGQRVDSLRKRHEKLMRSPSPPHLPQPEFGEESSTLWSKLTGTDEGRPRTAPVVSAARKPPPKQRDGHVS